MKRNHYLGILAGALAGMLALSSILTGCSLLEDEIEQTIGSESDTEGNHLPEGDLDVKDTDAYISSLRQLLSEDQKRASGHKASAAETCRLLLTDVHLDEQTIASYGADVVLPDGRGNLILQFGRSEDCASVKEQLVNALGEEHVEVDQYVDFLPEDSVTLAEGDALMAGDTVSAGDASMAGGVSSAGQLSYGPSMIGATALLERMSESSKKQTMIVAVVDTGVDTDHAFLAGRLVSGASVLSSSYEDSNGHGTHVSGIIADTTAGTAISIMPVQVLNAAGSGANSGVAAGIDWAVAHGAKVINLSLGSYDYGASHYLDSAVKNAVNQGVTVVVAAGNDAQDTAYFCPAHVSDVITVGAVDSGYNFAYFSNFGSSQDVSAPGVEVYSTVIGGYGTMSGTSMATPFVSAGAALLLASGVASSPAEVSTLLRDTSVDCGAAGWDPYYGAGVINLGPILPDVVATPTTVPTIAPTAVTTEVPVATPTIAPTTVPTEVPVVIPTEAPIEVPTAMPTPTTVPTVTPTVIPTKAPTAKPTEVPKATPTNAPTLTPTQAPMSIVPSQPGYEGSYLSVSVSSSSTNGIYEARLTLQTDADVSALTILVDDVDASKKLVSDGSNTYHMTFASSGHSYSIYSRSGSISCYGSF